MENTFQIRFIVYEIIGNQKIIIKDNFYDKVYPFGTNYSNPSNVIFQSLKTNYRSYTYSSGTLVTDEVYHSQILQGIVYHSQIDRLVDNLIDISNLIFQPIPYPPPTDYIGPIQLS